MSTYLQRLLVIASMSMIVGLSACGAGGGSDAEKSTTTVAASDGTVSTTEASTDPVEAASVDGWELPQSTTFNATKWTVNSAETRDRLDPEGDANPSEPETWVAITWTGENELSKYTLTIPAGMMTLRFEDNTFVVGESAAEAVAIQPEAKNDGEVAFLIPEGADLETATLEFNGTGLEPGRIRLDGSGTAEPDRVDAPVTPESFTMTAGACSLDMENTDAYFSREVYIEDGVIGRNSTTDARAPEGTVYLNLRWDTASTGESTCIMTTEDITVDGTTTNVKGAGSLAGSWWWAPNSGGWDVGGMAISASLAAGESGPIVATYAVPVDAEKVTVTYEFQNSPDAATQTITVDTSGLSEFEQ